MPGSRSKAYDDTFFELVKADAEVEEEEGVKVAENHGPPSALVVQLHHVFKLERECA